MPQRPTNPRSAAMAPEANPSLAAKNFKPRGSTGPPCKNPEAELMLSLS